MSGQPVPLPPARQPSRTTPRGHIKAVYLTDQELEQIFRNLDQGMSFQDACHQVGTSARQFNMRVGRHPDLLERVTKIREERQRQRQNLSSTHGSAAENDDAAGLHQS